MTIDNSFKPTYAVTVTYGKLYQIIQRGVVKVFHTSIISPGNDQTYNACTFRKTNKNIWTYLDAGGEGGKGESRTLLGELFSSPTTKMFKVIQSLFQEFVNFFRAIQKVNEIPETIVYLSSLT